MILPSHEQHYPDKLLPFRIEEYVLDSGPPTRDRTRARFVTGAEVLVAVSNRDEVGAGPDQIDPRYFIGTCFHESGCTNEWDTEIATASCPHGFVSVGAFQIGQEEASRFGYELEEMLELPKAAACMVALATHNRDALLSYAALSTAAPTLLDYTDEHGRAWPGGGLRAYLAIAHNHGLGFSRATIAKYGLDWARYKARNPHDHIVDHGYGDDCVTGGRQWPAGA